MTGRARIGQHTRIQIVWLFLQAKPGTCNTIHRHLHAHYEPCTHTAVDKTLRDMVRRRYLTRTLVPADRGQRQYLYAAYGNEPPPDGRVTKIPTVTAAARKARKDRDSGAPPSVDHDDDADDTWPGERHVQKGRTSDVPPIPSLGELLAR